MMTEPMCRNYEARMLRLADAADSDGQVRLRLFPVVLECEGAVDRARIRAVVEQMARAFDIFQLTFGVSRAGPGLSQSAGPVIIRDFAKAEVSVRIRDGFRGADLVRLAVADSASPSQAVVWLDHLLADRIAAGLLGDWLARRYNEADRADDCPQDGGYLAYSQSQHSYLASTAGDAAVRRRLSQVDPYGLTPACPLSTEGVRPRSGEVPQTVTTSLWLDRALGEGRDALAGSGVTPYMIGLTATLLAMRKHGSSDLPGVVGLTAGRFGLGRATTIGWLANLCVLGAQVAIDMSMSQVADQARMSVVNAITHEAVPYHELVRRLAPDQFGSFPRTPWILLADTSPVSRRTTAPPTGMVFREDLLAIGRTVHNLVVSMSLSEKRLDVALDFPPSLYSRHEVESFGRNVVAAALTLLRDPSRRVGSWLAETN